jgi:hypothetical protein
MRNLVIGRIKDLYADFPNLPFEVNTPAEKLEQLSNIELLDLYEELLELL